MAGDLTQMGDILREAGRLDEALAKYEEAVRTIEKADVPENFREATRRNAFFEQARLAVARNDLATARAKASLSDQLVDSIEVPPVAGFLNRKRRTRSAAAAVSP